MRDRLSLFRTAARTLKRAGIDLIVEPNTTSSHEDINLELVPKNLCISDSLLSFFGEFPAGLTVKWRIGQEIVYDVDIFGFSKSLRSHNDLLQTYADIVAQLSDRTADAKQLAKASQLTNRVCNWLPLAKLCSYDFLVVDSGVMSDSIGSVFLERHDWLDSPGANNGIEISNSFDVLLSEWSKFGFSMPINWDWDNVWNRQSLAWNSSEFDHNFR